MGRAASFHASTQSSPSARIPERNQLLGFADQTGFLGTLKANSEPQTHEDLLMKEPAATKPLRVKPSLALLVGGDAFMLRHGKSKHTSSSTWCWNDVDTLRNNCGMFEVVSFFSLTLPFKSGLKGATSQTNPRETQNINTYSNVITSMSYD